MAKAFADANGNLDKDFIVQGRPEFRDALVNGLEFWVLHAQAEAAFPGLSGFLQNALNTEAKKDRSELEGLVGMWHRACLNPPGEVQWDNLAREASHGLGFWTGYTQAMSQFLQAHTGCLLEDLNRFVLVFKSKGNLGGEFLWGVAKLQIKDHAIPHVAIATCMAQLLGPQAEDNFCRTIKAKHLAKLRSSTMKEKVLAAEAALENGKKLLETLGVTEKPEAVYQQGMLFVRTVALLLDIGGLYEKNKWETVEAIHSDYFRKFHWYLNVCFLIIHGLIMPASGAIDQTCRTA